MLGYTATLNPSPFISGINTMQSALGGFGKMLAPLAALTGALAGIGSAAALVGKGMKAAMDAEDLEVSFRVMLGSAKAAKEMMADLYAFSDESPFEADRIVTAGKQLLAFGFAAEQIKPMLTDVGDLAAGMGADIDTVAAAFGRIKSGQFGEAFQSLRGLGISQQDLEGSGLKFDASGSYKGSAEQAIEAVRGIIQNKFGGTMAELANTTRSQFLGVLERITDILRAAFAPISSILGPMLGNLANTLRGIVAPAEAFGKRMAEGVGILINAFQGGQLGELLGLGLQIGFVKAVNALMAAMRGVSAYAASLFSTLPERLAAAFKMLTNPEFWGGLGQILNSVAQGFVATLWTALAPALNKLLDVLRKVGVKIDFDADDIAEDAKANAANAWEQGSTRLNAAMSPLVDTIADNLTEAIAAAQSAIAEAPEFLQSSPLMDRLAALTESLKPLAAAVGEPGNESKADTATPQVEGATTALAKQSADAYARIGLFVGGQRSAVESEARRTNNILGNFQQAVVRGMERILDRSPTNELGWAT